MVDIPYLLLVIISFITKNSSNEPVNDVMPLNLKILFTSPIYFLNVFGYTIVDVKTSIIIGNVNLVGIISGGGGGFFLNLYLFSLNRIFQ